MSSPSKFPFSNDFFLGTNSTNTQPTTAAHVIAALSPIIYQDRIAHIEKVCAARSFSITMVTEGLYDMGNLSAVCRSADALGLGSIHVVKNKETNLQKNYKQSKRSSAGSHKWLDTQIYDTTAECLTAIQQQGYQIVATHLTEDSSVIEVEDVDWTKPTAVVVGNEKEGVSQEFLDAADARIIVPMDGFVDSYNISVAASLIMWEARRLRIEKLGRHGDLNEEEQEILKAVFFLRHKGRNRQYITSLLDRAPPEWQKYKSTRWGDREFINV